MTDEERVEVCQREIKRLRRVVRELEAELARKNELLFNLKKLLGAEYEQNLDNNK